MILLDTHVVIWAASDDPKLGLKARDLIATRNNTDPFFVSAITAWEIVMLVKKGRLNFGRPAQDWLAHAMKHDAWRTLSIDTEVAVESVNLPGDFHSDPADRFIVAHARLLGFSVVTADNAILEYGRAGHVTAIDASQ